MRVSKHSALLLKYKCLRSLQLDSVTVIHYLLVSIPDLWLLVAAHLEVDGLVVSSHGSLLESLGQSRVGVTGSGNVLARSAVLKSKHSLGDHLTGVGANDVNTENSVGLLVSNELDGSLGVEVGLGSRVGSEGELSDVVLDAGLLDLLLSLANPSNLGVGVHDRGDGGVVNVAVSGSNVLGGGNTLLLGLVGKHGAKGDISDASDVGLVGSVLLVDDDSALVVLLNTGSLEVQALGVGSSANGHEQNIGIKDLLVALLDVLDLDLDGLALHVSGKHLGAKLELDALLGQHLLGGLGDLVVHTSANGVLELDNGHLRAETGPDGTHLQTNDTATNDDELLGDALEGKSTGGRDNLLLINGDAGEGGGLGAGGNDDVLGLDVDGLAALNGVDLDLGVGDERAGALVVGDLVLLEEHLDTAGKTLDGGLLGLLHLGDVHLDVRDLDTSVGGVGLDGVVHLRVVEQRLGGNAANVEAGSSERASLLDTTGLEAGLGSLDGGNVASGASSDDEDIKLLGSWVSDVKSVCRRRTRVSGDDKSNGSSKHKHKPNQWQWQWQCHRSMAQLCCLCTCATTTLACRGVVKNCLQ